MAPTPYERSKKTDRQSRASENSSKKSYRQRKSDAPTFDSIPTEQLRAFICLSTTSGASPTLSYTRDGSSMVLALYYKGERYVDYISGPEDFAKYLEWVLIDLIEVDDITLAPFSQVLT